MKKRTIIFLFVLTMVLSFAAVVSAESNQEYYNLIDSDFSKIYTAAVSHNFDEANDIMPGLRDNIYNCTRYLTEKGQYSAGMTDILSLVSTAVESQSPNTAAVVANARCSLAKILLNTTPNFCVNPNAQTTAPKQEKEYESEQDSKFIVIPIIKTPRPHS